MAISCTLKAFPGKWYPRKVIRPSKMFGYVPFEVKAPAAYDNGSPDRYDVYGVIWINKASLVGSGGTGTTITDDSSTCVITA